MKKKEKNYQLVNIIPWLLMILLVILNINIYNKYLKEKNKDIEEKPCITEIEKENNKYRNNKEYYKEINYSSFKKLYKGKDIALIAVVDNTSNTYEKFKEFINKTSYYNELNINLLITSKLSKKNIVSFYELDERFSNLESNFLIVVKESKVLAIIELSDVNLVDLISIYK